MPDGGKESGRKKVLKFILTALIRFYKKHISPHFPARCKYYPTCSSYALQAIQRFGAVRGLLLAVWRLLRCNPFSMGGIDYVPEKFTFRVEKYNYHSNLTDNENDGHHEDCPERDFEDD